MIKNLPKSRFAAIVALFISLLMPTVAKAQEAYAVEDGTTLTFHYDGQRANRTGTVYGINDKKVDDNTLPAWASNYSIETVTFDASFKDYLPTSTASWFYKIVYLGAIENIENLNTQNVTDMSSMFQGCTYLKSLDLSGFNTANVTNMSSMFQECSYLNTLNLSGLNTTKVTNMSSMFQGCFSLKSLDLSSFNTANVTDMSNMFNGCSALTTIYCNDTWTCDVSTDMFKGCTSLKGAVPYNENKTDVSMANPYIGYFTSFDGAYAVKIGDVLTFYYKNYNGDLYETQYNVPNDGSIPAWANIEQITKVVFDASFKAYLPANTSRWFYNCTSLETIEGIENLNTENVIDMSLMFNGCESLTSVDVSGFNTANVTEMYSMFDGCSALTALDVSGFNTANVTDMGYMFNGCAALTTLDVTNFATERVRYMDNMFRDCSALTTIKCDNTWTCGTSTDMFKGCTALKGAVEYDESKVDVLMANPKTGYFTGEGTTAISEINADAEGGATVIYNLHGVKMHDDLQSLPAGIYIVNGKKVIVK